jgi:CheY-like chemotaxis protein
MNSIRNGSALILLAEDNENDAFLLVRAVKRAGIIGEVKRVRDGQETIDYLQAMDAPHMPDLLLLDLNMPRRNGFDVLTWLKERPALKQFPVVVLSSSALDMDIQKARDLGAEGYEVKPNDFDGLVRIVSALNERWLKEPVKLSARPAQPELSPSIAL